MDTVNVHSLNLGTWSKCLGNIKIELNCLKSFYSYNKEGRRKEEEEGGGRRERRERKEEEGAGRRRRKEHSPSTIDYND